MEKIFIQNRKGQKIAAVIHHPPTRTDKLAILCPGYLDTKDYEHLVELADVLSKKGYTAVRFDPTGTWESEGDIADYTTTQYLTDVRSVLEYMLKRSTFNHVLLAGHSRGGKISLLYAAKDPQISVVIGIMASSGHLTEEEKASDSERINWEKEGFKVSRRDIPGSTEKREYKVPYSQRLDNDRYDAVIEAPNIQGRSILLAGELDDTVMPDVVKEIFDHAHEPKKYILLKGIGHDYRFNPKEIEAVNNEILKALDR